MNETTGQGTETMDAARLDALSRAMEWLPPCISTVLRRQTLDARADALDLWRAAAPTLLAAAREREELNTRLTHALNAIGLMEQQNELDKKGRAEWQAYGIQVAAERREVERERDQARQEVGALEAKLAEKAATIAELRARLTFNQTKPIDEASRCSGCDGPHPYDTSVPSPAWNAVIRAAGLADYLCATCILAAFVKVGVSFEAELYGDQFDDAAGPPTIRVEVGSRSWSYTYGDLDYELRQTKQRLTEAEATIEELRGWRRDLTTSLENRNRSLEITEATIARVRELADRLPLVETALPSAHVIRKELRALVGARPTEDTRCRCACHPPIVCREDSPPFDACRRVLLMPHGLAAAFEATGKEQIPDLQRPYLYVFADWLAARGVPVEDVEFTTPDGRHVRLKKAPMGDGRFDWQRR